MSCTLQRPGRCYLDGPECAFRRGQRVGAYLDGTIMRGTVIREWIRTATGEHVVHIKSDTKTRRGYNLRHSFVISHTRFVLAS